MYTRVINMYDHHYYTDLRAEEKEYFLWVKEQKNRILNMSNVKEKQKAWSLLFPKWEQDDSYLETDSNIF